VLPGVIVTSYDISPDGESVVYASVDAAGKSRAWLARLDRRTPPTQLSPPEALGPVFGGENDVFFRGREGELWYIHQLKLESGQIRKFTEESALNSPVISPDRRWIVSWVPIAAKDTTTVVKAFPTDGGAPVTICSSCYLKWPRDQNAMFLSFAGNAGDGGITYVLRLAHGKALPDFPSGGVLTEEELKRMPNLTTVKQPVVFPGVTSSVYAFDRGFVQRNLHRIPIPE
jgi:Tol biopolymer transport system component